VGVTIAARVRTKRNSVVRVHDPWELSETPPPVEAA
jgi:hypothetical protein